MYIDLSILEEFATPFDREACEFVKEAPLTASLRKRMGVCPWEAWSSKCHNTLQASSVVQRLAHLDRCYDPSDPKEIKSWEIFSWYKCMLVDHFLLFDWESMATKLLNWAIACILGVLVLCSLMAVNGYEGLQSQMSAARHMQMVRDIKNLAEDW